MNGVDSGVIINQPGGKAMAHLQTTEFLDAAPRDAEEEISRNRRDNKFNDIDPRKALTLKRSIQIADSEREELLDFRAKAPGGPITRKARYPDSHLLHFSVLAAIVLAEGLANAYFFSKGSDLGLLGGWLQAITVSFTNVIAAFWLIGFLGLRNITQSRIDLKVMGAISIVVGLIAIFALNLTAAHFRDILEFRADDLAMAGVEGMGALVLTPVAAAAENPFGLQTLEALLLLILGTTFGLIAAYKGYTFDEPIPGYGGRTRDAKKAADNLHKAFDAAAADRRNRLDDETLVAAEESLLALEAVIHCAKSAETEKASETPNLV